MAVIGAEGISVEETSVGEISNAPPLDDAWPPISARASGVLEFARAFWWSTFPILLCSESYAPRPTHQLQAFLAGKQRGGLGHTEMPTRGCRQD